MPNKRKYFGQILTALVTVVVIFAAYSIFSLGRPMKRLEIIGTHPFPLVDINPEAIPELQILYRGEVVTDVYLFEVEMRNTGTRRILQTDYGLPLAFIFPEGVKLVDVRETDPPNIKIKYSEQRASFYPVMLNPKDTVKFTFIIIGDVSETFLEEVLIEGVIYGIPDIKLTPPVDQPCSVSLSAAIGAIAGIFVSTAVAYLYDKQMWLHRKRLDGQEDEKKSIDELSESEPTKT